MAREGHKKTVCTCVRLSLCVCVRLSVCLCVTTHVLRGGGDVEWARGEPLRGHVAAGAAVRVRPDDVLRDGAVRGGVDLY